MAVNMYLDHRRQFGPLLNALGLFGIAVEIGTHRGQFAAELMDSWQGHILCCIDSDFSLATEQLAPYQDRIAFLQETSDVAAGKFLDESVDFVYVAGEPKQAAEDFNLWWPKLRPRGLLAGYNLRDTSYPEIRWSDQDDEVGWDRWIAPAVLGMARKYKQHVYHVRELGTKENWSFFMIKP